MESHLKPSSIQSDLMRTMALENARKTNGLSELVLIAPPRFLGQLRKNLSKATQRIIVATHAKHLTQQSDAMILKQLETPDFIRSA